MNEFWSEEGTKLREEFSEEFALFVTEHIDEILAGPESDEWSRKWIAKIVDHLRIIKERKLLDERARGFGLDVG